MKHPCYWIFVYSLMSLVAEEHHDSLKVNQEANICSWICENHGDQQCKHGHFKLQKTNRAFTTVVRSELSWSAKPYASMPQRL